MSGPRLTVGVAPHWRTGAGLVRVHYAHLFALIPTIVIGAIAFASSRSVALDVDFRASNALIQRFTLEMGVQSGSLWLAGAIGTCALGIGAAILAEYASQIAMRQPYRATDGHGALMGLLLAMMMPPTVPWWVLLVGVFSAIFIGKQIYGGVGGYPMHPVAVGWLVLLLSWPNHIYAVNASSIASAHPLGILMTAMGGIALCLFGVMRWQLPAAVFLGVVVGTAALSPWLDAGLADQVLTGHVVLGAFFLASDSTCSPANRLGMWLFGFGVGAMIMLIRAFGIWPDAVPFAILLMNAVQPLLDRLRPTVRKAVFT